jgi:hypothetical protein
VRLLLHLLRSRCTWLLYFRQYFTVSKIMHIVHHIVFLYLHFIGVYLLLFLISTYCLQVNANVTNWQRRLYHAFGVTVLLLNTYFFISRAAASLLMWIIYRDYPGGPLEYFLLCSSFGWFVTGNLTQAFANMLTDLLLVSPVPY